MGLISWLTGIVKSRDPLEQIHNLRLDQEPKEGIRKPTRRKLKEVSAGKIKTIERFISTCCKVSEDVRNPKRDFSDSVRFFAVKNGYECPHRFDVCNYMRERFTYERGDACHFWVGIKVIKSRLKEIDG